MTDKQPEALYLAEVLENATGPSFTRSEREAIAAELRRLHAELRQWKSVFGHLGTPDECGNEWIKVMDQRDELLDALKLAWPIIEREKFRQECSYGSNFHQHRADCARVAYERAKSVFAKIGESV